MNAKRTETEFIWINGGRDPVAIQPRDEQDEFFDFEQLPDEPAAPRAEFSGWVRREQALERSHVWSAHLIDAGTAVKISVVGLGHSVVFAVKAVTLLLNGIGRVVAWVGAILVLLPPVRIRRRRPEQQPPQTEEETIFYYHRKVER